MQEIINYVIQLYDKEHHPLKDVAKITKLPRKKVRSILVENNIRIRDRSDHRVIRKIHRSCALCNGHFVAKENQQKYCDDHNDPWLRQYGLSPSQYDRMFETQAGKCMLCDTQLVRKKDLPSQKGGWIGLHIDHCHKTGKVRGILCGSCNVTIGHIEAKPDEWFIRVRQYLRTSGQNEEIGFYRGTRS